MTKDNKEPWHKQLLGGLVSVLFLLALTGGIGFLTMKSGSGGTDPIDDNYFLAHTKDPEGFKTSMHNKCIAEVNRAKVSNHKTEYCGCTTDTMLQLPQDRFNEITGKLYDKGLTVDDYAEVAPSCNQLLYST